MKISGSTALVTGASSGIGEAFARELAAQGAAGLILTTRSGEKLHALAAELRQRHGTTVYVLTADLAQPGAADQLFDQVEAAGLTVDVLINNAGVGRWTNFLDESAAAYAAMVELNITALVTLTHRALPAMLAHGRGGIVNVASTGAFQPCPYVAAYCASKAFVLSFSEALTGEYAARGISISALCPGNTTTGFQATAQADTRGMRADTPETVARQGLAGLLKDKSCVVVGADNYWQSLLPRLLPRRTVIGIVARMMGRRVNGPAAATGTHLAAAA